MSLHLKSPKLLTKLFRNEQLIGWAKALYPDGCAALRPTVSHKLN